MIIERILLQTIKFDLQLSHPYQYLIKFGKLLQGKFRSIGYGYIYIFCFFKIVVNFHMNI